MSCIWRAVLKCCDGDVCCHIIPVKTQWHTASVSNHQLSTRDPLNIILASTSALFSFVDAFVGPDSLASRFLLRELTGWTVFPCLSLFVSVFLFVYPHVHGSSRLPSLWMSSFGTRIALSSPWPGGPVSHRIRLCVFVCVRKDLSLPFGGWNAGHCRPSGNWV